MNASARSLLLAHMGIVQWRPRRRQGQGETPPRQALPASVLRSSTPPAEAPEGHGQPSAACCFSARPDAKLMRQYKVMAEKTWRVRVAETLTPPQRELLSAILSCCARRLDTSVDDYRDGTLLCFGVSCEDENSVALPALSEIMRNPGEMKPALWGKLRALLESSR